MPRQTATVYLKPHGFEGLRRGLELEDGVALRDAGWVARAAEVFCDPCGGTPRRLVGPGFVLTDGHRHASIPAAKRGIADEARHPADEVLDVFLPLPEQDEKV